MWGMPGRRGQKAHCAGAPRSDHDGETGYDISVEQNGTVQIHPPPPAGAYDTGSPLEHPYTTILLKTLRVESPRNEMCMNGYGWFQTGQDLKKKEKLQGALLIRSSAIHGFLQDLDVSDVVLAQ